MEWLPLISIGTNVVLFIYLAWSKESKDDRRRVYERLEALEKDAATVDNRISIQCHSRVKRAGEYWEFHNRVEDFMDRVTRSGVFGRHD